MKIFKSLYILFFSIFTFGISFSFAQDTARLQVIHNAADPGAASVDIYLGDLLKLDNFGFREATEFVDVPANVDIDVVVAGPNSNSAADGIATFTVNLAAGEKYIAVASGVLNPIDFADNPDDADVRFNIYIKEMAQEESMTAGQVEFAVMHGATDAPTVDIVARGVTTLVDNAPYPAITDYITVPAADYTIDVKDESGTVTVATFLAPLSGLADGAAFVFASGFLNPEANQNGEAFGIYAALANGDVVEFPAITNARLQVIHNAADPGAEVVDIYLGDLLKLDDFGFRDATEFVDVPANVDIEVAIAGPNSSSAADPIATFTVNLAAGEKYIAIANGVLNTNNFAANPGGADIGFNIYIKEMAQEESMTAGQVEFAVMHGATDAPTVDIVARGVTTLVDNAPYPAITDYITVPTADYTIDVKDESGTVTVATFLAPLSGLADGAAFVFASGFLNPKANQNGEAFGIYAALANGDVVEFPAITNARLQVIHNAADPAADVVDIYLGDLLKLDDFGFRDATEFVDVPANVDIEVAIAGPNSSSAADPIATFTVNLAAGEKYIAIANGVLNTNNFAANPGGADIGFNIYIKEMAQEESMTAGQVEFAVMHGATDAPTVDIVARGVTTLVDNASYPAITDYITVPAADYTIDVKDETGTTTVASFSAPLSGLADGAAFVFASGFLNPANNQNGKAFGIFVAFPNGDVLELPGLTTSVGNFYESLVPSEFVLNQNYPNPFNPETAISFSIPSSDFVTVSVFNTVGQEVATLVNENLEAGQHRVIFDAADLSSGVYYYRIQAGDFRAVKRMVYLR